MTTSNRLLVYLNHPSIVMVLTALMLLATAWDLAYIQFIPPARADAVPTPALPTPAPAIVFATMPPAAPTPGANVAAAGPNTTPRALVAYDAPDGRALGAIEAGRAYTVLATWGRDWLQADFGGSTGVVWARASDLLGVPAGLVDLQPTEAPRIVVVIAPAAPVVEQRYQAEAASTPAPCYHSERQALVHGGISVGVGIGDSCISQQLADEQAAASAFAQMNAALQGER